jgi:sulfur-carrier protein
MTVRVLLFASYADVLGAPALDVDLPEGSTVRDLLASIRARPGADRLPATPLVAVNQRYASPGTVVVGSDEVAIIPPVAGG